MKCRVAGKGYTKRRKRAGGKEGSRHDSKSGGRGGGKEKSQRCLIAGAPVRTLEDGGERVGGTIDKGEQGDFSMEVKGEEAKGETRARRGHTYGFRGNGRTAWWL